MKVLLRDSATREKSLLNDKEELERKVAILERFPPGSRLTDSEVCYRYDSLSVARPLDESWSRL